jgi:hypothetical protein
MKHLILIGMLLVCPILWAQTAIPFAEGSGTPEDPVHIDNFGHLYYLTLNSSLWSLHYIQTADIDATDSAMISDEAPDTHGWLPIGRGSVQFTGSYDGGGYTIQNLFMNRTSHEFNGLFGYIVGAKVQRVHLRDATINGGHYAGVLSGVAHASSVVSQCSATGSVSGTYNVGGLIGFSNNSLISNSYAHVDALGWDRVGGFIGTSGWQDQYTYINFCYSTGTVVSNSSGSIGGFSGWGGYYYHQECYWDTQSSGLNTSAAGTGKTSAEMMQQASYPMWNFAHLWSIDEGNAYPEIQAMPGFSLPAAISLIDLNGIGSEADPYQISNADELNLMRLDLAAHYILVGDIDLSSSVIWNFGTGWLPVGATEAPFTGSLDGAFHVINGLTINRINADNQGLFGFVNGAQIKNLDLRSAFISGKDNCGGIAGYSQISAIDNIDVQVSLSGFYAGGAIAGVQRAGSVERCFADANILNYNQYTGGIVGINLALDGLVPRVEKCGSIGALKGTANVGGIVGYASSGTIADCFSHCSIFSNDQVGGIVGTLGSTTGSAFIQSSYSTCPISFGSSAFRYGGIVGWMMGGDITNCYWNTESSGMSGAGHYSGCTGLNTSQMTYPGALEHFTLWDFDATWQQDGSSQQNAGYPYLFWQLPPVANLQISVSGGEPCLFWQKVPRITSYNIYSAPHPNATGEDWLLIGNTVDPDFPLPVSSTNFYMVRSVKE